MDESEDQIFLTNSIFGNRKPQITLSPVRLQKIKGNFRYVPNLRSWNRIIYLQCNLVVIQLEKPPSMMKYSIAIKIRTITEQFRGVFLKSRPLSPYALCIIHTHTRRKSSSTRYCSKPREEEKTPKLLRALPLLFLRISHSLPETVSP